MKAKLSAALKEALGPGGFLEGDDISAHYCADLSQVRQGHPALVLRPKSTEEVGKVLALCNAAKQPLVPQGGMTGLVDAAVPLEGELALTLERMRQIEELDRASATLTVQAGVPLQAVQEYADDHGFQFPLDLGARGSCTIGGNISTNAGGNRVVRFGMMRDSVLGLEVVLADGTVISSLNKMPKNNAGYDLKHLFIGSEGTLGVVTRAVLRLRPKPRSQSVAFCALPGFDDTTRFLHHCHEHLGGTLSAFEVLWPSAYRLVLDQLAHLKAPLPYGSPIYVLLESMGGDPTTDARRFEATLAAAAEAGLVSDAVIAKSETQAADIWAVRDGVSEALFTLRPVLNYDVSLPTGTIPKVIEEIATQMDARFPGHRTIYFGHIGDGNLHVSTSPGPTGAGRRDEIEEVIFGPTGNAYGSISAEHGVGFLRRQHLNKSRTAHEISLMRQLKVALDPNNILSPGRVIPAA